MSDENKKNFTSEEEELESIKNVIIDALDDIKAKDVTVIDTSAKTTLFKKLIIATGTSTSQVRAMGKNVLSKLGENGHPTLHSEGFQNGEWVLVDAEEIVVHIMLPQIREYYKLEEIWA